MAFSLFLYFFSWLTGSLIKPRTNFDEIFRRDGNWPQKQLVRFVGDQDHYFDRGFWFLKIFLGIGDRD